MSHQRRNDLKPVEFFPTTLAQALRLTGNAVAEFSSDVPLIYTYAHYSGELSRPWWLHFYGEGAPGLVRLLEATPLATLGGMFARTTWADFVDRLQGTFLDPAAHQWLPSLPPDQPSRFGSSPSQIARIWLDQYNVRREGDRKIDVATVRPVWYQDLCPASAVMEEKRSGSVQS